MVGQNRKPPSDGGHQKKRQAISLETKMAIIKRIDDGEKHVNVARFFQMAPSTIRTIYKQKGRITEHVKGSVVMQATVITQKRGKLIEQMEKLLTIWLENQRQWRQPLSPVLIQEKARSIFQDLKAKAGESAADETFNASHGWFNRFKKRSNWHHVESGEAASVDKDAADRFPELLQEIIEREGYTMKQIFNVDKTGLFWKKMPEKTHVSCEETLPVFKAAKDRLTLMLGGNADGSHKLKPLLVYRAANPRALKNVSKSSLPVIWMWNGEAWVTLALSEDWFYHHFIPEVNSYCQENNLPFKILLILDNAPGHPPHFDEFYPNVQVVYLPPNTISLLQPMDQGVIANFKKYYTRPTYRMALKNVDSNPEMTLRDFCNIDAACQEVSEVNLNAVWKNLCPQFIDDYRGSDQQETAKNLLTSLVSISEQLNLELEEEDFEDLLDSNGEELTNQDLMELEAQLHAEEEEDKPIPMKKFESKLLTEGFSLIDQALALFERQDPNVERHTKVTNRIYDAIQCYRIIYDENKMTVKSSLDEFFRPIPSTSKADEPRPSTSKTAESQPSTSTFFDDSESDVDDPQALM